MRFLSKPWTLFWLRSGVWAAVMLPVLANAQLVNQQPSADGYAYPTDGIYTGGTQKWGASTADNFTLGTSGQVSSIDFWGGSQGVVNSDLTNFSKFDIVIYNSDFSSVVFSTVASVASLGPTLTGRTLTDGADALQAGSEYAFQLTTNFSLAAGQYWLSIGSENVDPQGDSFLWTSSVADQQLATNFFDARGWQVASGLPGSDSGQAFEINGQAVPEPQGIGLLALGGLVFLLRRRVPSH